MSNYNTEIWKDIIGYEGLYQISSFGNVKSFDRVVLGKGGKPRNIKGQDIKKRLNKGYLIVGLNRDGINKLKLVSRLVAIHFIENKDDKPEVNHIDEDKQNNKIDNLEWVTPKENSNHGTRNKRISEYQKNNPLIISSWKKRGGQKGSSNNKKLWKSVLQIDKNTNEIIAEFESVKEALVAVGAGPKSGGLSNCLAENGRNKTYRGYKWKCKY